MVLVSACCLADQSCGDADTRRVPLDQPCRGSSWARCTDVSAEQMSPKIAAAKTGAFLLVSLFFSQS